MKQHEMQVIQENPQKVERAFMVGLQYPDTAPERVEELLTELQELIGTLDIAVTGSLTAKIMRPQPRYLIGSGKAQEIIDAAREAEADVIVFDDALSPSQQRNWEKLAGVAVIDRQEIILDIFGHRAHTKEAELQISLAREEYDLPRLKRLWTHLSRQRGGNTGTRGEGEQQIEVDARLVQQRIAKLRKQLAEVRLKREVQRKKRMKKPIPNAAIVGYTNAGKSSLLNTLTGASVLAEDKLFATLDPTIRRVVLPNQQELLLSDTVGFIRKLPHSLIEAFKATLEEAALADFIIEVIDVTSPQIDEHHRTTTEVLAELGAEQKFVITVFNKVDLVEDSYLIPRLRKRFGRPLFVSAATGEGMETLQQRLADELDRSLHLVELLIPHDRYDLVALLHRTSNVLAESSDENGIVIKASVPSTALKAVQAYTLVT